MVHVSLAATAVLLATLTASAQTNPVAYPQDSAKTSQGNYSALGFGVNNNGDEARFQMLIPASYLPSTGATISAIEAVTIPGTGALTYASLKITMSLTPATSLSSTFAANLPAPQLVLSASPHTINWTQSQWTNIPLQIPFVYDGQSNLVIEFQKIIDRVAHPLPGAIFSNATTGNPGRTDLPITRHAFGTPGSGASTAASARYASRTLKIRLLVDPPTLTIKSDRGGANPNPNVFAIGASLDLDVYGVPGLPYGHLFDVGFATTPTSLGIVAGEMWLNFGLAIALSSGVLDNNGRSTLSIPIPNVQNLVGLRVAFQSVTLEPSLGLMWTSAVDALINQ